MYAELSDVFYVIQKEYLGDIYPELFGSNLTDKESEAVANPYRFEDIAEGEKKKKELADEHYENKMEEIFNEIHELLNPGGVMTLMFTHREMDAWDTLTTALIDAGFIITATHPVKTEMSDRIAMQESASADSSILLVGRKRRQSDDTSGTLWEDVQEDFREIAEEEAEEVLESGYNISKTDTAIAAYGPTLQRFADEYPVVNKKGEQVRPREALSEARTAVTGVIAERFLDTEGIDELDSLTRWYILAWLIYENDTLPYDEGRQLGVGVGVDIDEVKRPTKLWRGGEEIELQSHEDRVQDIVMLRDDSVEDPSSRKYPVDPTDSRFTYTIDAIHAVLHIYDRDGPESAWSWLTERNMRADSSFETAVTALLEVLPEDSNMHEILVDIISGDTGEYLDININHIDMSGVERQSELGDHAE
jgi:adenine-specific DNA methylase